MCKYKIDIGSDGNLLPIKLFRGLFPHTRITDFNKSMVRKIILWSYNKSCIPQMAVCKVNVIGAFSLDAVSL